MKRQTLKQKTGEIKYRKRITRQHTGNATYFFDEFNAGEMFAELTKRKKATIQDFKSLAKKIVLFTPFLEIGSEYCVRSMVLTNTFGSSGVSLDIARSSLIAADYFAKKFKLSKPAWRICADAEALPFADNSFRFIFCYQTLHHFPNPKRVVDELFRVLMPEGYFFFAEEPIEQVCNLNFFRRPTKVRGLHKLLKIIPLLPFISTIGKTETNYGVLETAYPLSVWFSLLEKFDQTEVTLDSFGYSDSYPVNPHSADYISLQMKLRLFLFGGGIKALGRKPNSTRFSVSPAAFQSDNFKQIPKFSAQHTHTIRLQCPTCQTPLGTLDKTKQFRCKRCISSYFWENGILTLLPESLRKKLYD